MANLLIDDNVFVFKEIKSALRKTHFVLRTFSSFILTIFDPKMSILNIKYWSFFTQIKYLHYYPYDFCDNYVWQSMMSWVGFLIKDSDVFILFAENSQILFKTSVIPILLTFLYLVALNMLVNNQLDSSSNSTHHWGT